MVFLQNQSTKSFKLHFNKGENEKIRDLIVIREGINEKNRWFLIEALLELEQLDEVSQLLENWKGQIRNNIDLKLWLYYFGLIAFENSNNDLAMDYWHLSSIIILNKPNKFLQLSINYQFARLLIQQGILSEALMNLLLLANNFNEISEIHHYSLCLAEIGNIFLIKGLLDNSFKFYKKSLEINKILGNKRRIGLSNLHLGIISYYKGDLMQAASFYDKAKINFQIVNDDSSFGQFLLRKADVFRDQGHFNRALAHYELALRTYQRLANQGQRSHKLNIAYSFMKIGTLYQQLNKPIRAFSYIEPGLQYFHKLGNPRLLAAYIFKAVQTAMTLGSLTEDFTWIKRFPHDAENSNPVIAAYCHMVKAIMAEN
ncbi:MAG: hypothetical protein ACXAC7_22580, partial [Candidatus Hodarchaeales archaeon]